MEIKQEGDKRWYKNERGAWIPSVTTILSTVLRKAPLEKWRGLVGNEEADRIGKEAGERGTRVHAGCQFICEALATGQLLTVARKLEEFSGDERKMVDGFLGWAVPHLSDILAIEQTFRSIRYGYGCRCDLISYFKGEEVPTVFDIKTGKGVYPETALQISANGNCAEEEGLIPSGWKRRVIILSTENPGEVKVLEFTGAYDLDVFICCLGIFNWIKG